MAQLHSTLLYFVCPVVDTGDGSSGGLSLGALRLGGGNVEAGGMASQEEIAGCTCSSGCTCKGVNVDAKDGMRLAEVLRRHRRGVLGVETGGGMPAKGWIASVKDGVYSCKHCRGNVTGTCDKMARERHFLKFPNCSHSLKRAAKLRRKAALSQAAAAGAAAAAATTTGAAAGVAAAVGNGPPAPVSDDGGSKVDDVMGVGEDPVGEDGMDIDAPAWPPAGVEPAMRA
eukprot:jgi/Tetstr1/425546/TSEL_015969.t1